MLFNIKGGFSRGGAITEDSFTFTGDYLFARDEDGNWELALLESGTLNWLKNPGLVDICLVGAGKKGGNGIVQGQSGSSLVYSGKGGDGGRVNNAPGVEIIGSCTVVIGSNEGETSLTCGNDTYSSADGPAPKAGGQQAILLQWASIVQLNEAGKDGVFAYGAVSDETLIPELSGVMFGPSGGGGHANNIRNEQGTGVIYRGVYTDMKGGKNAGGNTGGGVGATRDHLNGFDATGYGGGGGGGYADGYSYDNVGTGGAGSNGILLIRNRRN